MTCWLAPETHTAANVSMAKRFARKSAGFELTV